MGMSPSNTSSLRRPMRLLSTVTQQLLGLRKQSTYRPRVLNSTDSLFTSSTWVHSYKTQQERREPFPARTVSPDTSWKILEHLNHILISKWVSMWKASSGDTRKLPCEAAMGSKPKSDFTYTLQTQWNFKFFHACLSKWPKRVENLIRSREESGDFTLSKGKRMKITGFFFVLSWDTQGSGLTGAHRKTWPDASDSSNSYTRHDAQPTGESEVQRDEPPQRSKRMVQKS